MGGNGSLTLAELTRIHHPQGIPVYLRKDAAVAWEAMRRASVDEHGVDLYPLGGASAYRTLAQQVELKRYWTSQGHPEKAAVPGTSNHGFGVAVDVGDPRGPVSQKMWASVRQMGPRFGWSWDEGQRVGENWHFRYVGGFEPPDPWAVLTDRERRLSRELLALRRLDHPTAAQVHRREAVWRWLRDQRKRIYRAAQETGWERANRRRRYQILRGLTHV